MSEMNVKNEECQGHRMSAKSALEGEVKRLTEKLDLLIHFMNYIDWENIDKDAERVLFNLIEGNRSSWWL